ncbi:hypothetical protein FLP41_09235 [Paracoccus marcusii]|uniref:hypothetical protein n=1 Tax=Paracoccus marcusii TaxID=59779 RepID=UPI002ED5D217|nr:hypothetical protein FLP41_09235 [Paracoccus marcusii]
MSQSPQVDPAKLAAAKAAVALVEDGMRLGLGTGSTASVMVRELAARVQAEVCHCAAPRRRAPRPSWPRAWACASRAWTTSAGWTRPSTARTRSIPTCT